MSMGQLIPASLTSFRNSHWSGNDQGIMRLLHLVLAFAVSLAVISNGIAVTTAKSIQDPDPSHQVLTRELSVDDATAKEEERGKRGGGGGGRPTSTGGQIHGTHTSIGLMYPNELSRRKYKKKCNRFTNWWKRLFDKSVKKCPKKGEGDEEEETLTRRLRA
ncbi:hypothetical protein PHYSODRAFT_355973 [Phytophthora sojae]|uniref:Uncharacterized protein n=1 Tax=Phytophthora sojae (strain P6497) TaxID=1094619 RepID=G5A7P7_PHYSP|nr:hypothetical protein PHYSODRAFT_355973 [Phytophthora sojae]EGZ07923.1 hypothetical protein PHYSODRAFT_355973 [Phytophthora sojae]|eukprot:XP_009536095.1 hypothetical protein PHYSODRAFT_355973 [Phytophthora sojae]